MSEPVRRDADFLIERYVAGQLTADEAGELLRLLQDHPELGAGLLDQLAVDALLREVARAERAAATIPQSAPRAQRRILLWAAGLAASVVLAALLLGIRGLRTDDESPLAVPGEATTTAVAVLTRAVNAEWDGDALRAGALLEPGWLKLKAGLVQVEFFSGARIVLEGPAEFRLVSTNEGFCRAGRLTAEVPPQAQGFRVGTPQQDIVDRGTAFGLAVHGTAAEVHVFKGKVELHGKEAARQDLMEGEAAAVEDGRCRRVAANAAAFVLPAELDERVAAAERRWDERWQAANVKYNQDRTLIARFDFEGTSERTLRNVAAHARGGDGIIVGCGRAGGRWPGKGALEFRGVGDRVRVRIPGEFRSLTFAAWVRVNGLDRKFNSLLLADGFDPAAVHWQIRSSGEVRLGVRGIRPGRHNDYDSPRLFTPERLGQWVHLAVTYDGPGRQITHYLDGKAVSQEPTRVETPLRIGAAEIGNWNPGTRRDSTPIRHFSGRIDELCVYDQPLSAAAIAELHRAGAGVDEMPR